MKKKALYIILGIAVVIGIVMLVITSDKKQTISFKDMTVVKQDENNLGKVRVVKDGKWGLTNPDGTLLVDMDYDFIDVFKENRAIVVKDGKYGFIDENLNVVVEPKYSYATHFVNGASIIKMNNKAGVINLKGEEIVKPVYYDYISTFDANGIAKAKNFTENKNVAINIKGEIVKDFNAK